jgi:hypothetical protein
MLKKQEICCCICGRKFMTDFNYCGGYVCSPECKEEYEWRKTLFILGKDYYKKEDK